MTRQQHLWVLALLSVLQFVAVATFLSNRDGGLGTLLPWAGCRSPSRAGGGNSRPTAAPPEKYVTFLVCKVRRVASCEQRAGRYLCWQRRTASLGTALVVCQ